MGTFQDFKKSFPVESHSKGKAFEQFLCDWFFVNHPIYKFKFKRIWLWEDWPKPAGVSSQDLGTDLIAEDSEGKVCAIQAKFYDSSYKIRFNDIATFLADSSKDYIDYRLLVSTAELGANAIKQLAAQEKPVTTFLLHNFQSVNIDWPKTISQLAVTPTRKPLEPRPHQKKAISEVCRKLSGRGQLIMACGTGKTLTAQLIAERLRSKRTLVLLPSLLLLSKTIDDWLENANGEFYFLPVCSDSSISSKKNDAYDLSTRELGYPVTTSPKEIREFLRGEGQRVIFCTYQSSKRIQEALADQTEKFDLIIADEAHRCTGKTSADYAAVLDANFIPARNRLFMTATPRSYSKRVQKVADNFGVELASMDDEEVFGPVLHQLSFGSAIEQNLLSDYQVVVIGVSEAKYSQMARDGVLVVTEAGIETDAETLASQVGLMRAVKKYDLKRVISFHSRVHLAKQYAQLWHKLYDTTHESERPSGPITYDYVSGAMPTAERSSRLGSLRALENERRYLLANARCLSEGVDVPALDAVAFVDPKNSEVDIVQAVGRAIRKDGEKALGSIIIPIVILEDEDSSASLASSKFDRVWAVVNALRSHDQELCEVLDDLRFQLGEGQKISLDQTKLVLDLPEQVDPNFIKAFEAKLVESTTESWYFWLGLLKAYKNEKGTLEGVTGAMFRGHKLGRWAANQRTRYRTGQLSVEKKRKLERLGFEWSPLGTRWDLGLRSVREFIEGNGHCVIPRKFVDQSGFDLGEWVARQRHLQTDGGLAEEKVRELERLGFVFNSYDASFERGYKELLNYKELNGHIAIPAGFKQAEYGLGEFVVSQRKAAKKGKLSQERKSRLDDLGFVWDRTEHLWEVAFADMIRFHEEHGHCRVPSGYKTDQCALGNWVGTQRKGKHMTEERRQRLDAIGFVWDVREAAWESGYQYLRRYLAENGDCLVPTGYSTADGFKLGTWVRTQIDTNPEGDRYRKLEELGFPFEGFQSSTSPALKDDQ